MRMPVRTRHLYHTSGIPASQKPPSQKPRRQLQLGQRERRRGGRLQLQERRTTRGRWLQLQERRGRRRRARRWYAEGEKMGGVYTECGMQSVACS